MTAITLPNDATVRPLGAAGTPTLEALLVGLIDYAVDIEQDPTLNPSGISRFESSIDRENKIYSVSKAEIYYTVTPNDDGSLIYTFNNYLTGVNWTAGTTPGAWGASNYLAAIVQAVVRLKKLELNPSKNPTSEQNIGYSFESETTIGATTDGLFTLAASMPIEFFGSSYPRPFRGKEYLANY